MVYWKLLQNTFFVDMVETVKWARSVAEQFTLESTNSTPKESAKKKEKQIYM